MTGKQAGKPLSPKASEKRRYRTETGPMPAKTEVCVQLLAIWVSRPFPPLY